MMNESDKVKSELKIVYDYVPWGMSPMYDTDGTYLKNCEVFIKNHALPTTSWLPGNYYVSKDILILTWNSSENPEDIRELCKAAISSKSVNNVDGGTILIGFQDNAKEYRAFVIFTNKAFEDFASSTAPDWLKF
jgi:hypothetical protein